MMALDAVNRRNPTLEVPMLEAAGKKQICVVADTNIWQSELQLRTPFGAALLFTLRRAKGRLGLPEVIEEEIPKHLVKVGETAKSQILSALSVLAQLTGKKTEWDRSRV